MKKNFLKQRCFFLVIFVVSVAFVICTFFLNKTLGFIGSGLIFSLSVSYLVYKRSLRHNYFSLLTDLSDSLGDKDNHTLKNLPTPAVLCDKDGSIIWCNEKFKKVFSDSFVKQNNIKGYLQDNNVDVLFNAGAGIIESNKNTYSVFVTDVHLHDHDEYLLYFFDITELKEKSDKLDKITPVTIIGTYDNLDEMFQKLTDGELSELISSLDKVAANWFAQYNCIFRKTGSERFIVICHNVDFAKMITDKFSVLNSVRNYQYNEKPCMATLSIGVGKGDSLSECEANAKQALDMALSRGGDQVAVRYDDSYEFFGGTASNTEKGNKVRSRVVASAIKQLVTNCDNAIIIGHKFADYDSMGTAIGVYAMMKHFGKNACIVYDNENTLAEKLVKKYVSETGNTPFMDRKTATQKLNENTLVFLLDTHRVSYCEAPEIVESASNVIVIDHHRKAVDYFDKAVVFHHNSSASSACEMFTELLEYISNKPIIGQAEADALFAGIILDTKNFILRSGVRTFEAASYLRSRGADLVKVKKLFASSPEEHKVRAEIVSSAFEYRGCAISVADIKNRDLRIISSQAADELLNISGIKASFVIFKTDDMLNISARSFGEINVQLIMEKLGGGGHLTMAASQMKNTDSRDALITLKKAIDEYINNL